MSRYFINFPKVKYELANSSFSTTKVVSNITLKTALQKTLPQNDPSLYQRYLVKENERAEDIAEFYYGNVNLVWLVYFSNQIIDPYTQWPKSSSDFNKYFVKKYASKSQPDGTDPIVWGQNTTRTDNIVRWEQIEQQPDENGFTKGVVVSAISPDSYTRAQTFNPDFVAGDWVALRYYNYELNLNEELRSIVLINDVYSNMAEENLKRLLNV
jgi:hypothetical protein